MVAAREVYGWALALAFFGAVAAGILAGVGAIPLDRPAALLVAGFAAGVGALLCLAPEAAAEVAAAARDGRL